MSDTDPNNSSPSVRSVKIDEVGGRAKDWRRKNCRWKDKAMLGRKRKRRAREYKRCEDKDILKIWFNGR